MIWIILAIVVVGWILLNLPRGRSDGERMARIHPYRRMLPYIMVGRNESIVFYDDFVRADPILDYIQRSRQALNTEVDITHCVVASASKAFTRNPSMNRFVVGRRLYQRKHIDLTFSMKRKRLDREAKLSAVKLRFSGDEAFIDTCSRINGKIVVERSGEETHSDKELGFFTRLPRPILSLCIRTLRWLDHHNLVPASFIENDGFYTSMFIANLGSVGMNAGFHHLYEYGTCPLFLMVGRIEDRPWVVDGKVVPQKILHLRYSYDERIDDGLTSRFGIDAVREGLENPDQILGPFSAVAPGAAASEPPVPPPPPAPPAVPPQTPPPAGPAA
jgi:hypothetical protein